MTEPVLVIYHAHCADGFTAAWVCSRAHHNQGREVELCPASYGNEPPDVAGRDVEIVDFSYPREDTLQMAALAKSTVILDHHAKAQTALAGLEGYDELLNLRVVFDMDRSGAMLAHRHHYPPTEYGGLEDPSALVQYVQDRDLWLFELPDSKAINAYIATLDQKIYVWDELEDELEDERFAQVAAAGHAVLNYQSRQVTRIAKAAYRETIAGFDVPVVNSPVLQSELGHVLCQDEPFAAVWYTRADGRLQFSLRSDPFGQDVNLIAQNFPGGGGHKHAAGFTVDRPLRIGAMVERCCTSYDNVTRVKS